ncbi:MAG: M48 family metallopeptidase [Acidobacteria bacterium]|nr:M48 family metallopeptidase [Acidobacteriota bacterium]
MNLYEQQARNRRRTWLVMAVFVGLVLLLGLGFDAALTSAQGAIVPIGTVAALLYGSSTAAYSYFNGDRAVLASTRPVDLESAIAANPAHLPYRQLQNVVDEMAIAAGLPRPRVYVIADQDPNALATGRDPDRASIAVTEGLLDVLDRDQLQGVIAHEMSHIRNYDIRLMTIVAALVGAVALLADWSARGWRLGALGGRRGSGSGRSREGGSALTILILVVWLLAMIVAPLVARLLAMMVSRQREFLADASAAELTRNPGALADALEAIEARVEPTRAIHLGSAQLCIADPLGRPVNHRGGRWANLLGSHPPMPDRIAALRRMAFQTV